MTTPFSRNDFRKSSYSNPDANCVEVAQRADAVELRDAKTAFGSATDFRLHLSPTGFAALIDTVR
ncbi:DUF397 domain-containing protein, partial [Actinokineospora spheciospongiae]|uniref:DUF397 domain-containing protein n=1 Tax=Actinokineospora spheciospongiae TaxID=909613 RepID=UPI00054F7D3C